MNDPDLTTDFDRVLEQWRVLGGRLADLSRRLAVETLVDVLPGASIAELRGEFNEDRLRTLRVRRVLAGDGNVLFDVEEDHDDPHVEATVDEVGVEYLDLLLDLTGDTHMGASGLTLS